MPYEAFVGGVSFKRVVLGIFHQLMKIQAKNNPYEREIVVIKSQVKKYLKSKGYRTNDFVARSLNDAVLELLDKAIVRTKLSGRITVTQRDI